MIEMSLADKRLWLVLRGGGWFNFAAFLRLSHRDALDPYANISDSIGFRLVIEEKE